MIVKFYSEDVPPVINFESVRKHSLTPINDLSCIVTISDADYSALVGSRERMRKAIVAYNKIIVDVLDKHEVKDLAHNSTMD